MKERTKYWKPEDKGKFVICEINSREGVDLHAPSVCPIPLDTKAECELVLDLIFKNMPGVKEHFVVHQIEDEYFPYKKNTL